MGLVDEIRNSRDSWNRRLEEQRVVSHPYDHEFEKQNSARIDEQIKKRREMVGKFPDAQWQPE